MSRILCPDEQQHLFSAEVMLTIASHPKPRAVPPPLPVAESDEISTTRAGEILGLTLNGLHGLLRRNLLRAMRKHERSHIMISYASVVELCDKLRVEYAIRDQRKRANGVVGRWPDKDLLPFRLDETISVKKCAKALRMPEQGVRHLCEQGTLVSYKLHRSIREWRIHSPSLDHHIRNMQMYQSSKSPRSRKQRRTQPHKATA